MYDAVTMAQNAGLSPELAAYMPRFIQIESGGNPNAQTGSYSGLLQMGPDESARYGGNGLANGAAMYADNAKWFQNKFGRPPSPTELYMVAQQGQGGIANHIANPNVPAWENMFRTAEGQQKGAAWAKKAIWGNVPDDLKSQFGNVNNLTSQQFLDLWNHKVEQTPMNKALAQNTGKTPMADYGPALSSAAVAGGPGAMYGGQPTTPLGMFGGLLRRLGVGADDEIGRKLQNAGAGLIAVGNPSGAASLQNAANMPLFRQNFSVYTDPYGRQGVLNHKTGQVNMFGQPLGGSGGPGGGSGDTATDLANTPKALQERLKLDQENSSKKMATLDEAAAKAQAFIDQNEYALKLSKDPSVVQGPGLWPMAKEKAAELSNGSVPGVDIAKRAELDKLNADLVGKNLAQLPGIRTAAPEIKFASMGSAGVDKPSATSQQIYLQNIQNAKRVIMARDIARKHYSTRGVLGPEYSKELQDWNDQNPVYQPDAIQPNAGPASPGETSGFKVLKVH